MDSGFNVKQSAQGHQLFALIVNQCGILFKRFVVVGARRMLQFGNALRRPHVRFAAHAIRVIAADIECIAIQRRITERSTVPLHGFGCDFVQANAFHRASGAFEIFFDEGLVKPDRFEDLRAAIRLIGRDAHLGHDFQQTFADRLDVVPAGIFMAEISWDVGAHVGQRFKRKIRMYSFGTIACEHRKVMHLARCTGLDD